MRFIGAYYALITRILDAYYALVMRFLRAAGLARIGTVLLALLTFLGETFACARLSDAAIWANIANTDQYGPIRANAGQYGPIWANSGQSDQNLPIHANASLFGPVRPHSAQFGKLRAPFCQRSGHF